MDNIILIKIDQMSNYKLVRDYLRERKQTRFYAKRVDTQSLLVNAKRAKARTLFQAEGANGYAARSYANRLYY